MARDDFADFTAGDRLPLNGVCGEGIECRRLHRRSFAESGGVDHHRQQMRDLLPLAMQPALIHPGDLPEGQGAGIDADEAGGFPDELINSSAIASRSAWSIFASVF